MNIAQARLAFNDTRAWYKEGPKSSNKTYDESGIQTDVMSLAWRLRHPRKSRSVEAKHRKIENRNRDADTAGILLRTFRDRVVSLTPEAIGLKIYNERITYGNCREMTCLALHFVRQRCPESRVFYISVAKPGDHSFLSVNAAPSGSSIRGLSDNGAIVIDPWLNICIEAHRYKDAVINRLREWSAEGKRIKTSAKTWIPGSMQYSTNILESQLTVHGADWSELPIEVDLGYTFLLE